jgi:hypothetical protein
MSHRRLFFVNLNITRNIDIFPCLEENDEIKIKKMIKIMSVSQSSREQIRAGFVHTASATRCGLITD